jgi:hypothetical protein
VLAGTVPLIASFFFPTVPRASRAALFLAAAAAFFATVVVRALGAFTPKTASVSGASWNVPTTMRRSALRKTFVLACSSLSALTAAVNAASAVTDFGDASLRSLRASPHGSQPKMQVSGRTAEQLLLPA